MPTAPTTFAATLAALLLALAASAQAAEETVLLRFEPQEIEQLTKPLGFEKSQEKTKDGPAPLVFRNKSYRSLAYYLYPGRGVGDSAALGVGLVKRPGPEYYIFGNEVLAPPEALDYYGIFQNNYAAEGGLLFNTCGPFRRMFPTDWSAWELLRFEAFAADGQQTVRVSLEDEQIAPPATRNVPVPPGRWTTVEVDLAAAARLRGLDLKHMATLAIAVVDARGQLKTGHSLFVDNLRLSPRGAAAGFPTTRDDSPQALPDYFRHVSRPQPEKLPVPPDRSPLGPQKPKPFLIPTSQPCGVMPVGWAAAYDNRRLLVGFGRGAECYVLQSLDAGATWRGLHGKDWPTVVPVPYSDHQCGHGDVAGQRADVFLFTNLGCRGTVQSALRLFTRRFLFTETGWVQQPRHALVDCDLRHCNSNQSVVRAPDGRLWEAHGLYGRLGTLAINVRFSDDDGATWKASREGTSGVIPAAIRPADKDGWGFGYTIEEPIVVPLAGGVGCLWQERKGYEFMGLKFSRFDGKSWSPAQAVGDAKRAVYNPTRPFIQAVSLGGKDIFAASSLNPGLLHYAGGQWKTELADLPAGGRVSVAGDKTVVVVAAAYEHPRKGPVTLKCWQRSPAGQWTGPVELAREETPLASIEPQYEIRVGYVVQPYAPPNFVPLAWTCEGQKWVKFLRVPVPLKP